MDAKELDENWRRACRGNPILGRLAEPAESSQLVADVLSRVQGAGHPPDAVMRGLAVGFSMSAWEQSPQAAYLQLATLVTEASKDPNADLREALQVLTILGDASVSNLLDVWRNEAEEDRLTRLGNRRRMESTTRDLVSSGVRFEYASIDVDGLKVVNDGPGGHDAGDELLRQIANELRSGLPGDVASIFRYGGDEFGVVFSGTETEQGLDGLLESIVKALPLGIGFSWGVATWPDDDEDVHTVTARADQRMYDRKRKRKAEAQEEV